MRKSRRRKKILILILLIFIALLVLVRYVSFPQEFCLSDVKHDDSELEIHMIDVGQAECILLIQGKHSMLIDTGEMFCGKDITEYLYSVGIDSLDELLLTHFHKDHMGGAHKIISSIYVKQIMCMKPKYINTCQEWLWYTDMEVSRVISDVFHATIIKQESPYEEAGVLKTFKLGDAEVEILSQEVDCKNVNDKCIVTKVSYKDFSVLFMADSESEVEDNLLEANIDISSDVLKVGHHGSKTSTGKDFLEAVNPTIALISCGEDNEYGHPNSFVMKKLENQEIDVYRTDTDGTIVLKTNGSIEETEVIKLGKN
ncbi:MAG: MBL fold metallo-hydrolase [Clostridia bacterium]|nr:MBL fold metallo-hydrolase [Clostridia bacterium]